MHPDFVLLQSPQHQLYALALVGLQPGQPVVIDLQFTTPR
jgi:hypothetical protein